MQDVLDEDSEMGDWLIERDSKLGVILHDRLMTDAALGAAPIKTEHSYSLHSDVESAPASPHTKVDGELLHLFGKRKMSLTDHLSSTPRTTLTN